MKQQERLSFIIIVLLLIAACRSDDTTTTAYTPASIEQAIKNGELGDDFAERAEISDNLNVQEIEISTIPFQVFTFSDYQAGYTLIVENDKLVLLCSGYGGGYAGGFQISEVDGRRTLTYKFNVGSGVTRELSGSYVLGSGQAEWQDLTDIEP
ncbi:MAG: hypothetical protein K8R76_01010 [Candidatus Aegiribacteria sp.]|nr:hypothetical protein [Candidatus Aegiribacteria sp.]